VTPVELAAGEGRQFISPGYDGVTSYTNQAKCLWTFAPAAGATLTFSCSAFSLTATSNVGELCTGDHATIQPYVRTDFQETTYGSTIWEQGTAWTAVGSDTATPHQPSPTPHRSKSSSRPTMMPVPAPASTVRL